MEDEDGSVPLAVEVAVIVPVVLVSVAVVIVEVAEGLATAVGEEEAPLVADAEGLAGIVELDPKAPLAVGEVKPPPAIGVAVPLDPPPLLHAAPASASAAITANRSKIERFANIACS